MSKYALLLSLGHNSSAIALCDGKVLCGYETERMTQIKSDSSFPYGPINEINALENMPPDTDVYVSHWFIDAKLPEKNKYWDPEYIQELFPKGKIYSVSPGFTHHDAHAWSSVAYMDNDIKDGTLLVVADGFGNFGECLSFYKYENGQPTILRRVHGFNKSLGMFYQYATAFMGMKMHNHEYKILGYEAHINEIIDKDDMDQIEESIQIIYSYFYSRTKYKALDIDDKFDPITDLSALINTQAFVSDMLEDASNHCGITGLSDYEQRIVISYIVQSVTERIILDLIGDYEPTNVLCSGGLFYNVKINYLLNKKYQFEVIPLAGDQGAAIGLYHSMNEDFVWPDHLFWGKREFYKRNFADIDGIICTNDDDELVNEAIDAIGEYGFVNIVHGAMEFGPRALCHTTTLALPVMDIVNVINDLNDRTTVMPMAPVVTQEFFNSAFESFGCKKSYDYMIVATKYKFMDEAMQGAAHYYAMSNEYTGRPQIVKEPIIKKIVEHFGGILINTSFNVHGVPIVFDAPQVIHSHITQAEKGISPVITIVKTED